MEMLNWVLKNIVNILLVGAILYGLVWLYLKIKVEKYKLFPGIKKKTEDK